MISDTPSLRTITDRLAADVPVIGGGLLANQIDSSDWRWAWAERALEHALALCDHQPDRIDAAIEAFAVTSLDFLRLQARFLRTGKYACGGAADLGGLYDDPDQMTEYLDGLALSYSMWPNHSAMLAHFVEDYLPRLPAEPRVLEIGPGHGLFASLLLEHRPDAHYVGLDISAVSLEYTRRALASANADFSRVQLVHGNATQPELTSAIGDTAFDGVVCCEVLEHVDDPTQILQAIEHHLAEGSSAFISTVANLEAIDHVFLFNDLTHIRRTIEGADMMVIDDRPLALPGTEDQVPLPLNYSGIIAKA